MKESSHNKKSHKHSVDPIRLVHRTVVEVALRWLILVWVMVDLSLSSAADLESQPSLEKAGKAEAFLSVFVNEPGFGKDPFFPNSKRREPKVVQPTPIKTPSDKAPIDVAVEGLELKGISLGVNKKLAIINNYTFAEGEERDVKVGNQAVKVRCISIQERSVSVLVNGRARKELNLRDGL